MTPIEGAPRGVPVVAEQRLWCYRQLLSATRAPLTGKTAPLGRRGGSGRSLGRHCDLEDDKAHAATPPEARYQSAGTALDRALGRWTSVGPTSAGPISARPTFV